MSPEKSEPKYGWRLKQSQIEALQLQVSRFERLQLLISIKYFGLVVAFNSYRTLYLLMFFTLILCVIWTSLE